MARSVYLEEMAVIWLQECLCVGEYILNVCLKYAEWDLIGSFY